MTMQKKIPKERSHEEVLVTWLPDIMNLYINELIILSIKFYFNYNIT